MHPHTCSVYYYLVSSSTADSVLFNVSGNSVQPGRWGPVVLPPFTVPLSFLCQPCVPPRAALALTFPFPPPQSVLTGLNPPCLKYSHLTHELNTIRPPLLETSIFTGIATCRCNLAAVTWTGIEHIGLPCWFWYIKVSSYLCGQQVELLWAELRKEALSKSWGGVWRTHLQPGTLLKSL